MDDVLYFLDKLEQDNALLLDTRVLVVDLLFLLHQHLGDSFFLGRTVD